MTILSIGGAQMLNDTEVRWKMKTLDRRLTRAFGIAFAGLATAVAGTNAVAQQDDLGVPLHEWSDLVWNSARSGDVQSLREHLDRVPEGFESGRLARVRDTLDAYRTNMKSAEEERAEARAEAMEDLRSHLEEGDLSQALRSAVAYQTLTDDMDAALEIEEVQSVIERAREEIPAAIEKADWLYAQELLFRLRTLFDDTSDFASYGEFDLALKDINRRVGLLQLYAPKRLYELRNRLSERYGEDPLPEFDPENVPNWRERLENVNMQVLENALRYTASQHIESMGSEGWRPLIAGGLKAMELLATTPALEETFPGLADEKATEQWLDYVHDWQNRLDGMPDEELSRRDLQQITSGLKHLNERSVRLPEPVVIREFGDGAMMELSTAKEDDYSDIIWPDQIRRFQQQTAGNFVGVGIYISMNEKRDILVLNPLEGTPAFRAGIRPDDVIATVDGKSTVGWSLTDAVDRITGKRGTVVKLGIKREGVDGIVEVPIERDVIDLPSVMGWWKTQLDEDGKPVWDWMIDRENGIGYVRLTGFSEHTYRDLREAWREMREQGAEGLILDLRFNPGGLLDQAFEVANMFIDEGEVVSIEGRPGTRRESLNARRNRAEVRSSGADVVVLVNRGSASASEIVSGALQAHEAAVIVGTRTWGKGSVQRVYRVPPNAQLKLTTQYYRLPPRPGESIGRLVHKRPNSEVWGVDPDIAVDMTPQQIQAAIDLREAADRIDAAGDAERPDPSQLITTGVDPQLEMALLILQARAVGDVGAQARLR